MGLFDLIGDYFGYIRMRCYLCWSYVQISTSTNEYSSTSFWCRHSKPYVFMHRILHLEMNIHLDIARKTC